MKQMKKYLVGGFVRDILRGETPNDRDYVVVGETPDSMSKRGFKQVGADFPVFLQRHTGDEYALARTERSTGAKYTDFVSDWDGVTLTDDLMRRDLTINAMALDEETNTLIDPFGGAGDIKNRVLRHTSDAFREDPLRILRILRFKDRFGVGWTIAPETEGLLKEMIDLELLRHVSGERILLEIGKCDYARDIAKLIEEYGLLDQVLPGVKPLLISDTPNNLFVGLTTDMSDEAIDILASRLKPTTVDLRAAKLVNEYWRGMPSGDNRLESDPEYILDFLTRCGTFQQGEVFEVVNRQTMNGYWLSVWRDTISEYPESLKDVYEGKELGEAIKRFRIEEIRDNI